MGALLFCVGALWAHCNSVWAHMGALLWAHFIVTLRYYGVLLPSSSLRLQAISCPTSLLSYFPFLPAGTAPSLRCVCVCHTLSHVSPEESLSGCTESEPFVVIWPEVWGWRVCCVDRGPRLQAPWCRLVGGLFTFPRVLLSERSERSATVSRLGLLALLCGYRCAPRRTRSGSRRTAFAKGLPLSGSCFL